jgi:hypothetical protein
MDSVQDSREERRQAALRVEIAARLSRVRSGLTDTEFSELVESAAQTAARFREIDAKPGVGGAAGPDGPASLG